MTFLLKDFDALARGRPQRVLGKVRRIVETIARRVDYCYRVSTKADQITSTLKRRTNNAVFVLQLNSEDLSLEFQIKEKPLIAAFIRKAKVEELRKLERLGDTEIALWDSNHKVCKIYPRYIDSGVCSFLLDRVRKTKQPVLKIRKIYSRELPLLRSTKLIENIVYSMKRMEILVNAAGYTTAKSRTDD
jgi:hypothetical protein